MSRFSNLTGPRIRSSTTVSPSSGTRRRIAAPSPVARLAAVAGVVVGLLVGAHVVGGRGVGIGAARPRPARRSARGGARRARPGSAVPRPSRARASAARRGSARRSRGSSARGRCPRSAAPACRPCRGRRASCRVPCALRRCAGHRSATGRSGLSGTGSRLCGDRRADVSTAPPAVRRPYGITIVSRPRGEGRRARRQARLPPMLIGAHVSTAGGLDQGRRARGRERLGRDPDLQPEPADVAADQLQRATTSPSSARRSARSRIDSATIHAVYLINCASKEREIRAKSIASLTHALRVGDGIGANGVVLHAGARKGEPHGAVDEAGREGDRGGALATPRAARCCSRTPPGRRGRWGATSTSSPSWSSCSTATRGSGICLDSCHLLASGFEIRTRRGARRGGRGVRRQGRARAAAVPAPQRLEDPARRQPRPPREPRRGRDRRARARRLPLRSALRASCRP